jgi:hypothetical protein
MSVVFPNSNLPTSSQPWAREVTKQLSNIIASSTSSQINNAARDNQLNSSIIALTGVVNDVRVAAQEANDAITGLTSLGSSGSAYSIYANNISGGTITGVTIQSAASGTRAVMSASDLAFYYESTYVGKVQGNDNSWSDAAALTIISADGTSQISVENSGISLYSTGTGNGIGVNDSENVSYGNFRCTNALTSNGLIQSGGNMRSGGTLGRIELDNAPAVTGASINTNGNIIRTSSSARYKTDISDLNISYESIINSPSPKLFRLKDDVFGSEENGFQANENARYYAGFIAEDFANTDLDIFVSHMNTEDGQIPDGFYYAEFTSALLIAVKEQHAKIEELNDRITELEKGA